MKEKSLFHQRGFTCLWWGQLLSIAGDRLTYLALMGLLLEHSQTVGTVSFATLLAVFGNVVVAPVLMLAPFAGALIDRMNLKHVTVATDLLRALNVLAITLAYAFTPDVWLTFALVFTLFGLNVLFLPAKSALIPEIVPPDRLLQANSYLAGAAIAATGAGALAGGFVVDRYGWALAMQIDATTYLFSAFMLALVPYAQRVQATSSAPDQHYLSEVWEGWSVLRTNGGVLMCVIALATVWWAGGMLHVAGNPHVIASGQEPGMFQLGVLLCVIGLGTAIGTWWINTRGRSVSVATKLGGGLVLAGAAVALFGSTTQLPVLFVAGCLLGVFVAPALILTETGLQQYTSPDHRARVFSGKDFLMRLTLLASVSTTAWLVSAVGTTLAIWVCAATTACVGVVLIRWRPSGLGAS